MTSSVVMTTYNGEKFIIQQLDSIRNQTLLPDEVIIRDDGSTDLTVELVRQFILDNKLDNWSIKVNETNKGFFDNFLDAVSEADGDIIFLADQDDVWDLNKIEKFKALYLQDSKIVMVQSNFRYIDSKGKDIPVKEPYHGKKSMPCPIELTLEDMLRFAGSGYTMSFSRKVSDLVFKNGLNKKKKVFEYHDLLLGQVASMTGKCFMLSDVVDSHRLHDYNVTQREGRTYLNDRTKDVQLGILKRRKKQYAYISKINNDPQKRRILSEFNKLTQKRIELIENKKFSALPFLFKKRKFYASKKGLITDSMYALGLERLLIKLYKII